MRPAGESTQLADCQYIAFMVVALLSLAAYHRCTAGLADCLLWVLQQVTSGVQPGRILCCGHSLGAAVAVLSMPLPLHARIALPIQLYSPILWQAAERSYFLTAITQPQHHISSIAQPANACLICMALLQSKQSMQVARLQNTKLLLLFIL